MIVAVGVTVMVGVTVGVEVTDVLQVVIKDTEFDAVVPPGHVT